METQQQRGPAWYDVSEALRAEEKELGCHLDLIIRRPSKPVPGGPQLVLRVEANQVRWASSLTTIFWRGYNWPNPDHKTMPGLMMRALHEITEELLRRREAQEKSVQEALPL